MIGLSFARSSGGADAKRRALIVLHGPGISCRSIVSPSIHTDVELSSIPALPQKWVQTATKASDRRAWTRGPLFRSGEVSLSLLNAACGKTLLSALFKGAYVQV